RGGGRRVRAGARGPRAVRRRLARGLRRRPPRVPGANRLGRPLEQRHLVLIGFMGAGKSTLGTQVAARLALPFVDVDDAIERRVGRISEFFDRYGEEGFRELERTTIEATLAATPPQVVAVGGGALATPEVRAL